ncbi:L-threonylcarbamoyladenylate synthase [Vagococcus silagei]|nr:L-threonylcarbamoyladenylate synthase [Vagococcus silagei]
MKTKILTENEIAFAAEQLKRGQLIAFPTETVYGLGADATNEEAVKQVYLAKGRPSDNPLIVHVASVEGVRPFVDEIPEKALKLMTYFWPGPLTIILKIKVNGQLSKSVTGGLDTVAFRMPNHPLTLELIEKSGTVLVGPSANSSGKPSPTMAEHVHHDLAGKICGILDGGMSQVGIESTVIDLSEPDGIPLILRPGAVTKNQLEAVIGTVAFDQHLVGENETPKAPGMKYKHYSPDTPVLMVRDGDWAEAIKAYQNKKIGLLANKIRINQFKNQFSASFMLSETGEIDEAMRQLFAGLRALDEADVDLILVEAYDNQDVELAYMNRLEKAAGKQYFETIPH